MSERKTPTRYLCKKCNAGFANNQTLQKHLADKKAHADGAPKGGGVPITVAPAAAVCKPCQAAKKGGRK